jgi:hydrogenase expression/formation protein HypD
MTLKHLEEYRDPEIARGLITAIKSRSRKKIRLMEVCGTHTVSIFRNGIRDVLPDTISLLSGPGCPVCVTAQGEIDAFIALAKVKDVIITTFGDLVRVPGTSSSLQEERAAGQDIRMVYSAMDALDVAKANPERQVVFLGVGFETTAPTIAGTLTMAKSMGLENFSVISAHKLAPPALDALMQTEGVELDGFIMPGHVSVIIGLKAYAGLFETYRIPCAVAGFEPTDILKAISMLVDQIETGAPAVENAYPRAVTHEGNTKAQKIMERVFKVVDANWRGLGVIPQSGLGFNEAFAEFDAMRRFQPEVPDSPEPKGCGCGDILTGRKTPPECALYKKVCTPVNPVGPCMVSSEGTCAAYYRYHS